MGKERRRKKRQDGETVSGGIGMRHALRGIVVAFKTENKVKMHSIVIAAVIITSAILRVSFAEAAVITICCAGAMCAELVNTAFEVLCDRVTLKDDPYIKDVKDIAAGMVLVFCIGCAVCAVFVFGPYVSDLLWA